MLEATTLQTSGKNRVGLRATSRLSDAMGQLEAGGLHAVLVEVTGPGGLDTLRSVMAVTNLPVLAVTVDARLALQAVGHGAQDSVSPGANPGELKLRLSCAMERQRQVTELRRLLAVKDQFVADAAHELRQPVCTLAWHARVLAERFADLTPAEREVAARTVTGQARFLEALVDELLDLCQLELAATKAELEAVRLDSVVAQMLSREPLPAGRQVDVDVGPGCVVLADRLRLGQVLANLLSNAYRYGGPTIRVTGRRRRQRVMLAVEDDGPGVPVELVGSLFEPFTRGADSSDVIGAGLGLALSLRMTRAMGGNLVHMPGPSGRGARFELILSAAEEATRPTSAGQG